MRLSDWLQVDGYELIISRVTADHSSRVKSALKAIDLPISILNSQTPTSVLETYVRAPNAIKKVRQAERKFVELIDRAECLNRWEQGYSKVNSDIFTECDAIVRNAINELIHHKIPGYYFLPRIEADAEEGGFVILLREVNHLPRDLAQLIARGLSAADSEIKQRPEWLTYIDFTSSDFSMPIGEITSPTVEHLLQTFSHLFGRIGLPDPDQSKVDVLCGVRPQ